MTFKKICLLESTFHLCSKTIEQPNEHADVKKKATNDILRTIGILYNCNNDFQVVSFGSLTKKNT